MKAPIPTLALIVVTLGVGILAGREIFPKKSTQAAAERGTGGDRPVKKLFSEHDRNSGSGGSKVGGGGKSGRSAVAPASAASVEEVFALVDAHDQFGTANRMREALGGLDADQLEALLTGMGATSVDLRFYTARMAVFSYLAELDAARAWQFTRSHPDQEFQNSFAALAIAALARVDLSAARRAVDGIENHNLKIQARNALVTAALKQDPAIARQLLSEFEESTPAYNSYSGPYTWATWGGGPSSYLGSFNGGYALNLQTNTSQLIGQWAEVDPAAAEAYARELGDSSRRSAALGAIAGARAKVDPGAALAWARGLDQSEGRDNAVFSVLGVLAQKDPQRVATMFDELPIAQRNSLMGSVASSWLQRDQAAALAWLESMPSSQARANAYNNVLYQLSQKDPEAAVELLDKVPLNNRNHQIPNVASAWAQRDFAAARDWVVGIDDPSALNSALGSLLGTWVKEDRLGAIEFLQDPSRSIQNREGHLGTIAGQWANDDSEGALEWVRSLGDDASRRAALGGLYNTWSIRAPEEVAAHLDSVEEPAEREALLTSLANSWLTRDRETALAWFDGLPQADRERVDSNIVSHLSYNAPQEAAARFDQMIAAAAGDPDKLKTISQSATGIAGQWATSDPQAAAAWAQGLEDEQLRTQAIGQVTSHWMNYDATGASDWLRELPAGKDRDSAAMTLVNQISHHDPAAAFEWADSIGDPTERYQSIERVIGQWTHRDKESARAAVESLSGLEPSQLEKLQRRVK